MKILYILLTFPLLFHTLCGQDKKINLQEMFLKSMKETNSSFKNIDTTKYIGGINFLKEFEQDRQKHAEQLDARLKQLQGMMDGGIYEIWNGRIESSTITLPFNTDVKVDGYIKQNGTVVNDYYRTKPNSIKSDNYSTKGNRNPYTGKKGTLKLK